MSTARGSHYACPTCNRPLAVAPGMFYFRGAFQSGLVCQHCNALWENPDVDWVIEELPTDLVQQKRPKKEKKTVADIKRG